MPLVRIPHHQARLGIHLGPGIIERLHGPRPRLAHLENRTPDQRVLLDTAQHGDGDLVGRDPAVAGRGQVRHLVRVLLP